jgi:purine catabolism regulator
MPATLISACERHGLNLLEVPQQTTFVAVSRSAAGLIAQREAAETRLALEIQRQLTAAAIRPDAQEAVVSRLAQIVDGAAFLLAADGRLQVRPTGPRPDVADVAASRGELTRIRPLGLRGAASASDEHLTSLLVPVGLRGRPRYYLAVVAPGRLSTTRRSAVTTAVALLGLAVEQESDRLLTRRGLWHQAHQLMVRGESDAARLVGEASGAPVLPDRVQVVRATGPTDALDDALVELEDAGHLAVLDDDGLRSIASPGRTQRAAVGLAERGLCVGVGEAVQLSEVATAHGTADLALERATLTGGVVHWEQAVRQGIVGWLPAEVATSLSTTLLRPLDPALVETLESFLKHHGSLAGVAQDLGLHRNTVRNRLATIEGRVNRSLDDPDTRAALWLAVQARAHQRG